MSSASVPVEYSKKRSRSPHSHHHRSEDVKRHRSRSPHRKPHHHHHHHHHHRRRHEPRDVPTSLPLNAQPLHKSQFQHYEGLFARYLDVQKLINIDDLSETEVRGRWKSFVGKWNRGELAEGWYDAEARWRAEDRVLGAAIPNLQDLQHRNELVEEAHLHDRANLLHERKLDRNLQKERVEELVPRADPGSRERQMEKKADKTFTLHQFREAKDGGDVEVGEQELMGGGDGEQEFQREVKQRQRAKSEREIRKEEALRARMAEREERMRGVRMKEEKTMEMLRNIAKTRFG
ncbi:uncharacterized protein SEPMUDRAFT_68838 [Sphaerulina musiva SO2202]|uniref:Uncharacterized protein n=1 Tax=Sphaerulina musiva (strain SO2202) TaxID=692275 RepID=M3CE59_SPHMS|nr:uncharacterized protein SEPMUDRAFT_68838 [Sphaerulina musiva SO2202]EMF11331.1 hypothetical protein SEPMUDRAFT_68838 [Sphaerulina musiva SO2202]